MSPLPLCQCSEALGRHDAVQSVLFLGPLLSPPPFFPRDGRGRDAAALYVALRVRRVRVVTLLSLSLSPLSVPRPRARAREHN